MTLRYRDAEPGTVRKVRHRPVDMTDIAGLSAWRRAPKSSDVLPSRIPVSHASIATYCSFAQGPHAPRTDWAHPLHLSHHSQICLTIPQIVHRDGALQNRREFAVLYDGVDGHSG